MADEEDLYAALGVSKDVDADGLRDAWRELARAHHPDRNPDGAGAAEFRRASAAWAVLKDPDRRLVYDRFGLHAAQSDMAAEMAAQVRAAEARAAEPPPPRRREQRPRPKPREEPPRPKPREEANIPRRPPLGGPGARSSAAEGARRMRSAVRSGDLRTDLVLTLEEAALGGPRTLQVESPAMCTGCDGTGLRPSGRSCSACRGSGVGTEVRDVAVTVPVSVASGATLVVRGGGALLSDGGRGDLHVTVGVRPHPVLKRHGLDLHVDLALLPHEAADGGVFEVPALGGTARVTLAPGTPAGKRVRVPGRGLPGPGGRLPGDLHVTIVPRPR